MPSLLPGAASLLSPPFWLWGHQTTLLPCAGAAGSWRCLCPACRSSSASAVHNLLSAPLALNRTRGHGTAGAARTQVPASRSASPEQPRNGKATAWGVAPEHFFLPLCLFLLSNSSFHLLQILPFVPSRIFPYLVIPPCCRWRGVCVGAVVPKGFPPALLGPCVGWDLG